MTTPAAQPKHGPGSTSAVLRALHVTKSYPGQKALDDVTLEVQAGTVHALLGENGSGKSTLIKVLAGIVLPDPGSSVELGGAPLPLGSPSESSRAGLCFVHQKLNVVPAMSAAENLGLQGGFARPAYIDWDEQARRTRALLSRLGLDMDVHRPLQECRAVERSGVAIAKALAELDHLDEDRPRLLVLDEPTASLPAAEVEQLLTLIKGLAREGTAIVYVSHRLDEVLEIAERATVLREGRVASELSLAGVDRRTLVERVVGEAGTVVPEPRVAVQAGPGRPALRVRGLTTARLRALDLEVMPGEVLAVAGLSGSGRDELARALVGTHPVVGRVEVGGVPLTDPSPRRARRVGMVLAPGNTQPHSATPTFDVRENLTLASLADHVRRGSVSERRERAAAQEWVRALDVRPQQLDRQYARLSGGNQQKVILGKWLSTRPKVLVLDEPTAGVDVGARRALYREVHRRAQEGLAVVVCSSDVEDLLALGDRILVLRDGSPVWTRPVEQVDEHDVLAACLGEDVSG